MTKPYLKLAKSKYRNMKAWLITWDWDGKSEERADKIVGILSSRWGTKRVQRIVDFLTKPILSRTVNSINLPVTFSIFCIK